jgi:hypothetical protein
VLLLNTTTDKLQLVTSAAVTVDVHASYTDYDGSVVTAGRQNAAISTATTTDVVAAPASGISRNVKHLTARNKHASSSVDVTLQFNQNGTIFELHKVTLAAGKALEYIEGIGFAIIPTILAAIVLLTSGVISSAQATLDIPLGEYTEYRGIVVELTNFTPVTDDVELWMRTSTDGGTTYDATAGNYRYGAVFLGAANLGPFAIGSSSATRITVSGNTGAANDAISNVATEGGTNTRVELMGQTDAKFFKCRFQSAFYKGVADIGLVYGVGARTAAQDVDAVRFLFESGNIASGKYAVYGLR